jgi:excinuclease UvrABC nuclease subunit
MTNKKDPKWITLTMALSNHRIEFSKDIIQLMFAPVVYVVMGRDAVLYVGMSKQGLGRVFDRKHHVLTQSVWSQVESIQVLKVDSIAAALTLEAHLIQEFKPVYNDRQCIRSIKTAQHKKGMGATAVIEAYAS